MFLIFDGSVTEALLKRDMASQESFVRAEGDFRLALLFFPLLVCGSVMPSQIGASEGSAVANGSLVL